MSRETVGGGHSRPIIFSDFSVRAILDGRKTMTRRVIRWPAWASPENHGPVLQESPSGISICVGGRIRRRMLCPFGVPGDRLWGREAFLLLDHLRSPWPYLPHRCGGETGQTAHYRECYTLPAPDRWLPPLFMPRWASRIDLTVVSIRVERLWEMTHAGAIGKGDFMEVWDKLHQKREARTWEANPWVWVVEFRHVGGGRG